MFVGARLSVLVLNLLFRFGTCGDVERDVEEAARRCFDNTVTGPTSGRQRCADDRRTRSPMERQPVGIVALVPSSETRASLLALPGEDSGHRGEALVRAPSPHSAQSATARATTGALAVAIGLPETA
jgi:hypothetical protein